MKDRKLLMIPGPIEFDPAVLSELGKPTTSHLAPDFIESFGQALERMRKVFLCQEGQPFIVAGSGTLAMDLAGANLVEPGDRVVVVNTGYFSDRFGVLLERYGAQVTHIRADAVGGHPAIAAIEKFLGEVKPKLVTITQVDTSTAVLADVQAIARLGRQIGALVVVDGVCSVAGEDLRMDEWGVDAALTASQKAIGTPPGLALLVAGPRALDAFHRRKTSVLNYYGDWTNWLPVMQAYEQRKPSYFGTPAVNLVSALNVSLGQILAEGMEKRFGRHCRLSAACKAGIRALGLGQVPLDDLHSAHTMTAPRYPAGVEAGRFIAEASNAGVILAGGLHPEIRSQYFRIGHMGAANIGDVLTALSAVETALSICGYACESGASLLAAQQAYTKEVEDGPR